MKKIYVDCKEIKHFIVDVRGRIVQNGAFIKSTWENTKIRMSSVKVGEPLELTFNGKVWTELAYNTTKVEDYEPVIERKN